MGDRRGTFGTLFLIVVTSVIVIVTLWSMGIDPIERWGTVLLVIIWILCGMGGFSLLEQMYRPARVWWLSSVIGMVWIALGLVTLIFALVKFWQRMPK